MSRRREGRRSPKPLRRTPGTRPVRRTMRLYVEGEATEVEYIDALRRLPQVRDSLAVTIVIAMRGAVPLTLVSQARNDRKRSDLDIDELWCVFDVEQPQQHPNLREAVSMARANGIRLAVSNPCFELWLILHLAEQTAFLSTDDAVRLRRQLDGSGSKHLDPTEYMEHRAVASARAARLRDRHTRNGTLFPDDDPSTSVDKLVIAVEQSARGL